MNTLLRTALLAGAAFLMSLGQPECVVTTAWSAQQACDTNPTYIQGGPVAQGNANFGGGIATAGCGCGQGCSGSCAGGGNCNGGCGAGCGCLGRRGGGLRSRLRRGRCVNCPECQEEFYPPAEEFCDLEITPTEVEKTCFEIGYKTICIPKVVPPWKDCCEPKCAEARSVKVLKKKKYKCPACKYTWKVVKPELPVVPEAAAPAAVVPANNSYYNPGRTIQPPQVQQPQAAAPSNYYGANQLWNRPVQQGMPLPANARKQMRQMTAEQMQQLQIQRIQMRQQQIAQQAQRQAVQQPRVANQRVQNQGTTQAGKAGTISDYYRNR